MSLLGALGAAGVLLAATIPVGLAAIAEILTAAGLPRWAAYLIVAIASAVVAAIMAAWAWHGLRTMPAPFVRSRDELAQNIASLKEALKGRTAPFTRRGGNTP